MRHGKAVGSGEERRLSEEGREEVKKVARCLPRPTKIYTSPLRRAKETTEVLSQIFGVEVVVEDRLAPGKLTPEAFLEIASPGALYVGHNPDLERLLALIGCSAKLSPGGAAVVDLGNRRVLALLNPDFCP